VTHAEKAGITAQRIASEMRTVFTQRRFFSRTGWLSVGDRLTWLKGISTPLKQIAEYLPAYAWA